MNPEFRSLGLSNDLLAVEYEEIMKNYNPFEGMDGYAIMP